MIENRDLETILFNQKMDWLVENFLSHKSVTPQLKAVYVKFVNVRRRLVCMA